MNFSTSKTYQKMNCKIIVLQKIGGFNMSNQSVIKRFKMYIIVFYNAIRSVVVTASRRVISI